MNFAEIFGPIVKSGCIVSPSNNKRTINVSSGDHFYGDYTYHINASYDLSMIGMYNGIISTKPFTEIPLEYDNNGILTSIPLGKWVKHTLYALLSESTTYLLVYGDELFSCENDARLGYKSICPSHYSVCPLSTIIVTYSDITLPYSRFQDIRPRLVFNREIGNDRMLNNLEIENDRINIIL